MTCHHPTVDGSHRPRRNGARGLARLRWYALWRAYRHQGRYGWPMPLHKLWHVARRAIC